MRGVISTMIASNAATAFQSVQAIAGVAARSMARITYFSMFITSLLEIREPRRSAARTAALRKVVDVWNDFFGSVLDESALDKVI
jgi:hypothetical protein